ncbi:hypothetical protein GCM10027405_13710 [Arthrobacter alkaliphilus]|jgi:hypothetical protein|uniref:DUF2510 domain-containing protein n=1 Tax=Arthrobacter alkaliphilus TaxID=369936 RepID=UPI001F328535|nr:DUF2510 domain-containing protein [Arthrobacter alkaliphilus]
MTVPQHNSPTPPGWYPDPSGSGQLRWWDGNAWTGNAWNPQAQAGARPGQYGGPPQYLGHAQPAPRPEISRGTPVYNPFIWLVTLLPVVSLIILLFWNPVFQVRYVGAKRVPTMDPSTMFSLPYIMLMISGWLIYGVSVFFAYLDWRKLQSDGVVRPFHWAWAFLGAGVYVVGRSVIVHKVAQQRGLGPVWALIGVTALSLIVVSVKASIMVSTIAKTLPM